VFTARYELGLYTKQSALHLEMVKLVNTNCLQHKILWLILIFFDQRGKLLANVRDLCVRTYNGASKFSIMSFSRFIVLKN
jgi:hypothetical protein